MSVNRPLDPENETVSPGRFAWELASDVVWMVALTLAAFKVFCRMVGTSPTVWPDTLIENLHVTDCVVHSRCTAVGVVATVGIFHSAGYLHWRSLMEGLGFTANGTYLALLAMNALGVALVAIAARRLAGPLAGALAALVMVAGVGIPTQLNVITDLAPMPFLGAVYLLLAQAVVARPDLRMTALLGCVAGVLSNVYATGLLCGISGVWVALLIPDRRRAHVAIAAASFVGSTFLLSPATWLVDAQIFFSHHVGNGQSIVQNALFQSLLVQLLAVAALAYGAVAAGRVRWLRRKLDVPAAVLLPLAIPLVLGSWIGKLDPQPKYCAHVLGAVAVTLAVVLVAPLRAAWLAVWRWITRRFPRLTVVSCVGTALEWPMPLVAASMIFHGMVSEVRTDLVSYPLFTYRNLASVAHVLVHDRGWSLPRAALNLKAPDDMVRRAAYRWTTGWRATGREDTLERAYLLKLPAPLVPAPLPPDVIVAESNPHDTTLVAFTCSWIDWRTFRLCSQAAGSTEETCVPSGLPTASDAHSDYMTGVVGMPRADRQNVDRLTITLHFALHPTPQCPEEWVHMPRLPLLCPGRITGVDGSTSQIEQDGQWVRLAYDPAAPMGGQSPPRDLAITWDVGGPDCWNQFRAYPPFFLEGDPVSVSFLATILARQQRWVTPMPPTESWVTTLVNYMFPRAHRNPRNAWRNDGTYPTR